MVEIDAILRLIPLYKYLMVEWQKKGGKRATTSLCKHQLHAFYNTYFHYGFDVVASTLKFVYIVFKMWVICNPFPYQTRDIYDDIAFSGEKIQIRPWYYPTYRFSIEAGEYISQPGYYGWKLHCHWRDVWYKSLAPTLTDTHFHISHQHMADNNNRTSHALEQSERDKLQGKIAGSAGHNFCWYRMDINKHLLLSEKIIWK